jgi:hypothetical protein
LCLSSKKLLLHRLQIQFHVSAHEIHSYLFLQFMQCSIWHLIIDLCCFFVVCVQASEHP